MDAIAGSLAIEHLGYVGWEIAAGGRVSQQGMQVAGVVQHSLRQVVDLGVVGHADDQRVPALKSPGRWGSQASLADLSPDITLDLDRRDAQDASQQPPEDLLVIERMELDQLEAPQK